MTGDDQPPEPEPPAPNTLSTADQLRLVEALVFASPEPVTEAALKARLPEDADLARLIDELEIAYRGRGVMLARVGAAYAFRTAPDLAPRLAIDVDQPRRLGRAATETLAIIAYNQTVTRGEIEQIRGVATARGTLDTLMEAGWIRPGRRRMSPGRPLTWVTTPGFLDHFGLQGLEDLPNQAELEAAGLLDARPAITTLPGGRIGDATGEAEGGPDGGDDGGDDDRFEDDGPEPA